MRASVALLLFFILLNGWAGLIQEFGLDDHMGISAETGDPDELEQAREEAKAFDTGSEVGGTLIGMYNALGGVVERIFVGLQPGVQMLVTLSPDGAPEQIVVWLFSITQMVAAIDLIAFFRGVDL